MVYIVRLLAICFAVGMVEPHGYLKDPPARGSMWKVGWDTPKNYDHNQLFCGGKQHQHGTNGGKCGVCGDKYDAPQPRDNEGGGAYSSGIISKCYEKTSVIEVKVEITANHLGYFEFRLCEHNDPFTPATQECLDEHVLTLYNGKGTRYNITSEVGEYTVELILPEDVQCSQCILQWKYNTGNSWGCDGGVCGIGYGEQEQFYGCSDVSVLESCENFDHFQYLNGSLTKPSTTTKSTTTTITSTQSSPTGTTASTTNERTTSTTAPSKTSTQTTTEATTTKAKTTESTTTKARTTEVTTTKAKTTALYGECYPKPEFEDQNEAFGEICQLGCSKGLCLSYYCRCDQPLSTTKSTLMTIISSSQSSTSSTTTTPSSDRCQDIEVTDTYKGVAGMLEWCVQQCVTDQCTPSHCVC